MLRKSKKTNTCWQREQGETVGNDTEKDNDLVIKSNDV